MATPPIAFFRKEDFPEIENEAWAQRLFAKLNAFARQTQYGLDKDVSVSRNMAGFWWEGVVGNYKNANGILFPFNLTTAPTIANKQSSSIQAFPFSFKNQVSPKRISGVFVAQAFDVTEKNRAYLPALLGSVAWNQETDQGGDVVKVYAINGMFPGRSYKTRLLVLSD